MQLDHDFLEQAFMENHFIKFEEFLIINKNHPSNLEINCNIVEIKCI